MKKRPLFCVGELVGVENTSIPELNTPRAEVTNYKYNFEVFSTITENTYVDVHAYQTSKTEDYWLTQECLYKLPPDERLSFEECLESLMGIEA